MRTRSAKLKNQWPNYFSIEKDYIVEMNGDVDVWIVRDKATKELVLNNNGKVWYDEAFTKAVKLARKLTKDKIFEEIILSND